MQSVLWSREEPNENRLLQQGRHLKFKFNLPELGEKLVRNIAVLKQEENNQLDDEDESSDYSPSSNENDFSYDEQEDDMAIFSNVSQESSLLGDREYFSD